MSCRVIASSVVLGLALLSPADAGYIGFALDPPSGAIAGGPGTAVGWGLTVTTTADNPYWFLLSGSDFTVTSGYGNLGTYADLSGTYADIITPGAHTVYLPFSGGGSTGAGRFTFDQVAFGLTAEGTITFTYDFYSDVPGPDTYAGSDAFAVQASVQVPEPGTAALLAISLGAMGYVRKRRKASARVTGGS